MFVVNVDSLPLTPILFVSAYKHTVSNLCFEVSLSLPKVKNYATDADFSSVTSIHDAFRPNAGRESRVGESTVDTRTFKQMRSLPSVLSYCRTVWRINRNGLGRSPFYHTAHGDRTGLRDGFFCGYCFAADINLAIVSAAYSVTYAGHRLVRNHGPLSTFLLCSDAGTDSFRRAHRHMQSVPYRLRRSRNPWSRATVNPSIREVGRIVLSISIEPLRGICGTSSTPFSSATKSSKPS